MKVEVNSGFVFKIIGLIFIVSGFLVSSGIVYHSFTELQKKVDVIETKMEARELAERIEQIERMKRLREIMKNGHKYNGTGGGASSLNSGSTNNSKFTLGE